VTGERYDEPKQPLSFMLHSPGAQVETGFLIETPPQMAERVFRAYRPSATLAAVRVEFKKFANVNSTVRFERDTLLLRISDLLEGAPAHVLEALMHMLIGKMFGYEVPANYLRRYKLHVNHADFRRGVHAVRQQRGRKVIYAPQGHHYNLEEVFADMNLRFFHGLMPSPTLGWSTRRSRTLLGHYDPSHNMIVLSRLLDSPHVPRLAVDYVMYHEMLHVRYPTEHRGTRRTVHTKEFKAAEKLFPQLDEANAILKRLSWNLD
jgi:hypothetical protein